MISAVAPLVRGSTYRRGIYLLLGGVILLPYALLAVVFVQTLTTPAGARGVTVLLLAATVAIAGVPAFLQEPGSGDRGGPRGCLASTCPIRRRAAGHRRLAGRQGAVGAVVCAAPGHRWAGRAGAAGPITGRADRRAGAKAGQLAERDRLARELHDPVGHALTVTTLQAAAARRLLDDDLDFVRGALGDH